MASNGSDERDRKRKKGESTYKTSEQSPVLERTKSGNEFQDTPKKEHHHRRTHEIG